MTRDQIYRGSRTWFLTSESFVKENAFSVKKVDVNT